MKDKFKVYTTIKDSWKQEAWDSAIKRRKMHSAFGSKKHWTDPDKGEYLDEYYGSLAQILFRERIIEIGLSKVAEFSPLYTDDLTTMPPWDAKVFNLTIDVKAVPPDTDKIRKRMLIKLTEYKGMAFYIPIKFWNDDEYSFCGMASKKEVEAAPKMSFGYQVAYWFYLDKLRPLEFVVSGNKITL